MDRAVDRSAADLTRTSRAIASGPRSARSDHPRLASAQQSGCESSCRPDCGRSGAGWRRLHPGCRLCVFPVCLEICLRRTAGPSRRCHAGRRNVTSRLPVYPDGIRSTPSPIKTRPLCPVECRSRWPGCWRGGRIVCAQTALGCDARRGSDLRRDCGNRSLERSGSEPVGTSFGRAITSDAVGLPAGGMATE